MVYCYGNSLIGVDLHLWSCPKQYKISTVFVFSHFWIWQLSKTRATCVFKTQPALINRRTYHAWRPLPDHMWQPLFRVVTRMKSELQFYTNMHAWKCKKKKLKYKNKQVFPWNQITTKVTTWANTYIENKNVTKKLVNIVKPDSFYPELKVQHRAIRYSFARHDESCLHDRPRVVAVIAGET